MVWNPHRNVSLTPTHVSECMSVCEVHTFIWWVPQCSCGALEDDPPWSLPSSKGPYFSPLCTPAYLAFKLLGFLCPQLLSCCRSTGVSDNCYCAWLYTQGARDLNHNPRTCVVSALPTEPSPQSKSAFQMKVTEVLTFCVWHMIKVSEPCWGSFRITTAVTKNQVVILSKGRLRSLWQELNQSWLESL